MPIKPVSGEIKSQEINDNLSYLDSAIKNVDKGSPKGAFNTIDELNAAYPNGDSGIYVVITDGKWYFWDGSKWTAGGIYQSEGIAINSVHPDNTTFMTTGKNLFNKNARELNVIVSQVVTPSDIYDATDWIPVFAGKSLVISRCRNYVLYDREKNFLKYTDTAPDYVNKVVTPSRDGFLRATIFKTDVDTVQIEEGTVPTSYEPYYLKIPNLKIDSNFDEKELLLYKKGNIVNIRGNYDKDNDIVVSTAVSESANKLFNFNNTYIIPKYTSDDQLEEMLTPSNRIHATMDDITPIRTWYTVGANHGYAVFQLTGISGKSTADRGSQWTDGFRTYTLLNVVGTTLVFGFPYEVINGIISVDTTMPVARLIHVKDATNTADIDVSSKTASQFYPSINEINRVYLLDGRILDSDGVFSGSKLQVIEKYNIVEYQSIIDYARANIGVYVGDSIDSLDKVARLRISYEFSEGINCTIYHSLYAFKKIILGNCGFLQSAPLNMTNYKTVQYMPNVKPKGGYDFQNLVDMTSYSSNLVFESADYINASIPPNRYVQWLMDGASKKAGFTMGYIPDKSDSSNGKRITNTNKTWDLRSTKKNYPIALSELTINPGDYFNFIGYRNYLSPSNTGNATNITSVEIGNETYVYLDFHVSMTFGTINLEKHIGKSIEVVEKNADFTLINDIVDAEGIVFNVKNGYGRAILKLI